MTASTAQGETYTGVGRTKQNAKREACARLRETSAIGNMRGRTRFIVTSTVNEILASIKRRSKST